MDRLPSEIIFIIFEYLDNESLLNAIQGSRHLAQVFSTSPKLLLKFNLNIDITNPNVSSLNGLIERVPFRNVAILNATSSSANFQNFLRNLANSIEILTLKNIQVNDFRQLLAYLRELPNLKILNLQSCSINNVNNQEFGHLQSLKCVSFEKCSENFFKLFHGQKSITKLEVSNNSWTSHGFSHIEFNALASTLPNLHHIVLNGTGTGGYFDCRNFPYKIQKLEAFLMTFYWTTIIPRLGFLRSQQGHLKELTIHKLPYDYDGGEVLKYIIEEMGLEKFYYGKIPLILDGRKQNVQKFLAAEVHISSFFEMFRQFPTIKSFTLFFTQTSVSEPRTTEMLNPPTNLFNNLNYLDILDHSGRLLLMFVGFYKNCRNITKLSIRSNDQDINSVLQECLPEMTQLREIYLETNVANEAERMDIIRRFVPNVVMLTKYEE